MSDDDNEARRDESERDSLQKTISDVETALAGSTAGARAVLEIFLLNARGRVAALDKKIKDSQVEKEKHAKEVVEAVSLAQKESALSSQEKETFSGFLKEEFFTKKNFARLDQFYAHTWDRLSEGGKDEMSHRVWEGIRRDEYTFTDLPKIVQEKEAGRAYSILKGRETEIGKPSGIPLADREDFIDAYERGTRDDASKILERQSFRENMAVGNTGRFEHSSAGQSKEAERKAIAGKADQPQTARNEHKSSAPAGAMADIDLASIKLDGMTIGGESVHARPPSVSDTADVRGVSR